MTDVTGFDTSGLGVEVLARIRDGSYRVVGPGMKPNKPVVVDSSGKWVKGSGRPAKANDPAETGKIHGFKHSRDYVETLYRLVPPTRVEGQYAVTSMEELLLAARRVTIDTTQKIPYTCPECKHESEITIDGKPDPKVLTWLLARLAGEANKTADVNIRSEELLRIVEDKRLLVGLEVVGLTPENLAERKRAVLELD